VLTAIIGSYIQFPRRRFRYENFCVKVRTIMTGVAFASSARVCVSLLETLYQPLAPFGRGEYIFIYLYICV
jgi:hypothetical protein